MISKILIIQTAFIGDVILVTSLVEKVIEQYPDAQLQILVRNGTEELFKHHPKIHKIIIWNKKKNKFINLFKIIKHVRSEKFDMLLNVQRFFSSGLITALSKAKIKIGFKTNPLSCFFSKAVFHAVPYQIEQSDKREYSFYHEVQRNYHLLKALIEITQGSGSITIPKSNDLRPKLYFGHQVLDSTSHEKRPYVVIAPASVWFTKQWAKEKWIDLLIHLPAHYSVFLVGAKSDFNFCQDIMLATKRSLIVNTCGKLSLLQTALLMKNATRVICNDSAPSHLASAVNAPQTVIFCSTVTKFGFGPLSDDSKVVELVNLSCRPCGLHGHKKCPLTHFRCALDIDIKLVLDTL